MLIYDGVKSDFIYKVDEDMIAYEIEQNILRKMNRRTTRSEFLSWENSLQYMYKVLNDEEIPSDAGVAIEYNIPQTSKRVDFLISGFDRNNQGNIVIIELKQWQELKAVDGRDGIVETYLGGNLRRTVHPSYQAWSYSMLIKDYNQTVQEEKVQLRPCAYLHNYRRKENGDPLDAVQYQEYCQQSPAFTRGQVRRLREFIKQSIVTGDKDQLIYRIDNARIRPSKSLQNTLASMLKGNQEFFLIDEQKVVYEEILNISRQTQKDHKKRVMIVEGGPGTGKTVVAINAMVQLTNEELVCQYVSKNSAPRNVYASKLKGDFKKSSIDNLFKGSGNYTETMSNVLDTVLVDEAHRLTEKSGMFSNLGENQIKEIIDASKVSIFFIDEHQRISIKDIGSKAEIEKWAAYHGAELYHQKLVSQFRCDGSDGYLAWIDNVLEIDETANYHLKDIDYDFQVMDSPHHLKEKIVQLNASGKNSRILAGYCWEWPKSNRRDTHFHDIVIGDFSMSWNLDSTMTYAIDKDSVNEIGCIHTSQGLEFDYVGVIIGEDLRFENDMIVTDFNKRAKSDSSLKGIKSMYKEDPSRAMALADEIIKNTYRTLMTRGLKGCYVYCVDPGLQEYLKERMKSGDKY